MFWSKNPGPLLPYLREIDDRGIGSYCRFTLNDYEADGFKPGLPALSERVETVRRLAFSRKTGF